MRCLSYDQLKDEILRWQEYDKQIPVMVKEYLLYQYMKAGWSIRRLLDV